uniref:DUF4218 domain-containing protein n=1 Tax=Oryza brachyantha TaxID=4533 RepID=J3LNX2_ORYBR
MYPIERRLYTLKRYVRNRARPEGSIAEAYIADECLTFCSKYMDGVETRFNREPRNKGFSNEEAYEVDVFGHGVHFTSASELQYDENGFDQMVWYVLNNCSQIEKYVKMFRDELEREGVPNIERKIRLGFQICLRDTHPEEVSDDVFSLACGPDFRVKKYSSCIVNGVRFNTVDRDKNKKTQNSGVMTQGTHNGQFIDFFGTLKEIIELEYNSEERTVVLFKCDWFKLDGRNTQLQYDGFFKSINVGSLWYKDDSLILATQARKVFYLADTLLGNKWQVVQTYDHRHLYNVREIESAQYNAPAYQEDECCDGDERRATVIDMAYDIPLNRKNEALFLMLLKLLGWLKNVTKGIRFMAKKGIRFITKRKKMTHFWSIVAMMEALHLMLTVMMNSCYQLAIIVLYAEFVIL